MSETLSTTDEEGHPPMSTDTSHRRRRLRHRALVAALLGASVVPLAAGTAGAGLLSNAVNLLTTATSATPCGARDTSTPFASFRDTNSYFLMPGGDFEAPNAAWSLSGGAARSAGSETFAVHDAQDASSLTLPAGAKAVSPTICVARGENTVRLFVQSPASSDAVLHVTASIQDPTTGLVLSTSTDVAPGPAGAWAPTPQIAVPNLLGGVVGAQNLTLTFTTSGNGTWGLDDVYVDPFKSR
jgi:hypothetical protein